MTFEDHLVTVEDVDEATWLRFAPGFVDYNYEHAPGYAVTKATRSGASTRFLLVRSSEAVIGGICARVKKLRRLGVGVAYVSGGPLIHHGDAESYDLSQLKTVLGALKAKLVDDEGYNIYVRPAATPPVAIAQLDLAFSTAGFRKTGRLRSYNTVIIDLADDVGGLRRRLSKKWRYELVRSEKEGLVVDVGCDASFLERFMGIYQQMRQVKAFDSRQTPELFAQLPHEELGLTIRIAHRDGQPVAGHVVSQLGDTAVYLFGATNETGRNARAGYLLHWTAMIHAKTQGCRWYDVAGIDRKANPGGYQFKTRMGGHVVEGLGAYEARPPGLAATLTDKLLMLRNLVRET